MKVLLQTVPQQAPHCAQRPTHTHARIQQHENNENYIIFNSKLSTGVALPENIYNLNDLENPTHYY